MASDDEMDVEKVHESLAKALRLQLGSLLTMTMLAGTLRGMTSAAVKSQLRDYVRAEIDDTYLLAEKLTALGGSVPTSVPDLVLPTATDKALTAFLDNEADVLAALHAVIAATGKSRTAKPSSTCWNTSSCASSSRSTSSPSRSSRPDPRLPVPPQWIVSPRASIATNFSTRPARVSGRLAAWIR